MAAAWRVAVVGPGGVGGLLGAVLTNAGHDVVYLARPETAAVLNGEGLALTSTQFGALRVPARAVAELTDPVDLCLVTVKTTQLDQALAGVPARVLGDGLVLPLLNGIDHMAELRARYPAGQVVGGVIRVETTRVAPGRIEHTSPFSWIEVAHGVAPQERVEALAGQLRQAGFEVAVRDDESAMLWDKLALLAPLAILTTHAGAPIGTVRDERRADLDAVVDEVAAVAVANGAQVDAATVRGMLDLAPAGLRSSMLRDAQAHRPTELDAIGGAVLRAADRLGLTAPVTARLVHDLRTRSPDHGRPDAR
jgi:2-dehydropantoate 2-reductase